MLKRLSDFSLEQIVDSINEIFSDYEYKINWSVEKFKKDIVEYSIRLDFSLAECNNSGNIRALSLACMRGKRARMDSFGVKKPYRLKGIATFLLNEQIKLLKSVDIEEYELEVLVSNERAIRFYEHNGFTKVTKLISLFSPLPVQNVTYKNDKFETDFDKAIGLCDFYSSQRKVSWLREAESLRNSNRYKVLTTDSFYVFYFTDQNQCYIVDAYGKDLETNLFYFFSRCNSNIFSVVSLFQDDLLYKTLVKNNFMEFSTQWLMKTYF